MLGISAFIILPIIFCVLGTWICFANSEPTAGIRNKLLKVGALAACVSAGAFVWAVIRIFIWSANTGNSRFTLGLVELSAISSFIAVVPVLFGKGPGRVLLILGTCAFAFLWGIMVRMGLFERARSSPGQYVIVKPK